MYEEHALTRCIIIKMTNGVGTPSDQSMENELTHEYGCSDMPIFKN